MNDRLPDPTPSTLKDMLKIEAIQIGDIPPGKTLENSKIRDKIHQLMEKAGRSSGPIRLTWDTGVIYISFPDVKEAILLRGKSALISSPDYTGKGEAIEFTDAALEKIKKYLKEREIRSNTRTLLVTLNDSILPTA